MHVAFGVNHVILQLEDINAGIAPSEPSLSLIIDPNGGVDMVPRTVLVEGTPESIAIRTFGTIGYGDANSHTARELGVSTDIPVEPAIALNDLCCPCAVVGPRETLESQGRAVVGPVDHITGAIDAPLLHPEEVCAFLVVTGKDVKHGVAYVQRCRVGGVTGLHDGVTVVSRCRQLGRGRLGRLLLRKAQRADE